LIELQGIGAVIGLAAFITEDVNDAILPCCGSDQQTAGLRQLALRFIKGNVHGMGGGISRAMEGGVDRRVGGNGQWMSGNGRQCI